MVLFLWMRQKRSSNSEQILITKEEVLDISQWTVTGQGEVKTYKAPVLTVFTTDSLETMEL